MKAAFTSALSLVALLSLAACHSPRIFPAERAPLTAQQLSFFGTPDQVWDYFLFDIQVRSGARLITQYKTITPTISNLLPERLVTRAGSYGSSDTDYDIQGSTGLWFDENLQRAAADLFITVSWPKEMLRFPVDMTGARISSAQLSCQGWAMALAIDRKDKSQLDLLAASLSEIHRPNNVAATIERAPYKAGPYWVIPVTIMLPSPDFATTCLKSRKEYQSGGT